LTRETSDLISAFLTCVIRSQIDAGHDYSTTLLLQVVTWVADRPQTLARHFLCL
jgi:hypothetical protein